VVSQRQRNRLRRRVCAPMIAYETAATDSSPPRPPPLLRRLLRVQSSRSPSRSARRVRPRPDPPDKVDAERVTLVLRRMFTQPAHCALSGSHTSDLTLDRGSFSIVRDGNFSGEGLLDPIHAKERRLLSYCRYCCSVLRRATQQRAHHQRAPKASSRCTALRSRDHLPGS